VPLYEYQCEKNGHRFEKIQKFSDKPKAKCPECGSPSKRLLSPPAIHFKGSGWYVTDYARKGKSGDSGKDEGKKESGAKESSKPDKKGASSKKKD